MIMTMIMACMEVPMIMTMIMACMEVVTWLHHAMLMVQEHEAYGARAKDEREGGHKAAKEGGPRRLADMRHVGPQLSQSYKEEDPAAGSKDGTLHNCAGVQIESEDGTKEAG